MCVTWTITTMKMTKKELRQGLGKIVLGTAEFSDQIFAIKRRSGKRKGYGRTGCSRTTIKIQMKSIDRYGSPNE